MKKILLVNYYLVLIGWFLFLNDYAVLAILVTIGASAITLGFGSKFQYWRLVAVAFLTNTLISFFLKNSSIPIYFPELDYFLISISINNAIVNEYMHKTKLENLGFIVAIIFGLVILSTILIKALPSAMYTIFTKDNLVLMILFIFLPYLISPTICLFIKLVKYSEVNLVKSKSVKI